MCTSLNQNLKFEYQDPDEKACRSVLASLVDAAVDVHDRELLAELLSSNNAMRPQFHAMTAVGLYPGNKLLFVRKMWLQEISIETATFYRDVIAADNPVTVGLNTRGQRTNGR